MPKVLDKINSASGSPEAKAKKGKAKMRKAKMRKAEYHHGDLRKALIDAALKMLEKTPPSQLSMRELARSVNVSSAARFRHFKNKDELLAAISQQGFEIKKQFMLQAIEGAKGDPLQMYLGCGLAYFRMGLKYPQHFKLMMTSEVHPRQDKPDLALAAVKSFVVVRDMVESCQKKNKNKALLGQGDSYQLALMCWSLVHGFTILYADERLGWLGVNEKNAETLLTVLLQQFLKGAITPLLKIEKEFALFNDHESKTYLDLMESLRGERR